MFILFSLTGKTLRTNSYLKRLPGKEPEDTNKQIKPKDKQVVSLNKSISRPLKEKFVRCDSKNELEESVKKQQF